MHPIRRCSWERILALTLLGVLAGIFSICAWSDQDWEILYTKHYWSAQKWYYGGYSAQLAETPAGYRAVHQEGVPNYTNIFALQEKVAAGNSRHPVEGFPATERLAVPFLLYVLLHFTAGALSVLKLFWVLNIALWLLAVFLSHRVAALFFSDRYSPWLAAILVASYPALNLTFHATKLQSLGTIYLLAGIYLHERHLRFLAWPQRWIVLTGFLFLGLFATGGWVFLTVFIVFRCWWLPRSERWRTLGILVAAVVIAQLWLAALTRIYHLPSATGTMSFSLSSTGAASWHWIRTWASGGSVAELQFLNFKGYDFFAGYCLLIVRAFGTLHGLLLGIALAALWLEPKTRIFTAIAVPLLLVGHAGLIMTGVIFHYGYLSFPAGLMLMFAAAGGLGRLIEAKSRLAQISSLVLLLAVGGTFLGSKKQAGLYFGGNAAAYRRDISIYYGDETNAVHY
jgi:hypothetical protein